MSKILVTGGAGFIGSHLVNKLIKNKHGVIVIDDFSGGDINNVNPKANFWNEDCRHVNPMDLIFKKFKPEIVFHLACNAAEQKAQFSPIDITSRNYDAFIKVLTPFIKYGGKRFIFTSSIAVYGALQTPFKEIDKPEPEDLYGISKLACEQTLKVMSKVHKFKYVIARPHNVYGSKQNMQDPYRNVVTIWMNALLRKEPYYIYGDGKQTRAFSYIADVVDAIYKCGFLENISGMTFNIGSDWWCTLNDLAKSLQKVTGKSLEPVYLDERPQEIKAAIADHTLARKHLFYKDKTDLEEGLSKTWQWAKFKGAVTPKYTPIEIPSKKIPFNWQTHV